MKKIYVCGPTVYAEPHIGNMRPIITFDIFRRALEHLGEEVKFVHNITDIDDKIIKRAKEKKVSEAEIAKKFEFQYLNLMKLANVIKPDSMPRVMEHMDLIISYIKILIEKKNAYVVNGTVYFSVKSIEGYGKVSNRNLETMKYENGKDKKYPADFALWKKTTEGINFDSPWGKGRPGWHTECAVFINSEFEGQPVDIHGGGIDLIFPHHENENAQYLASNGTDIAKEWRHVGHLNLNGEKMSKSLGNILTASDYFEMYSADALRYIFLTSSYSAPIDLSEKLSKQAFDKMEKFRKIYIKSLFISNNKPKFKCDNIAKLISEWKFSMAMKEVNLIIKDFNKEMSQKNAEKVISVLRLLGFNFSNKILSEDEKDLFREWNYQKNQKNFKKADIVRGKLIAQKLL